MAEQWFSRFGKTTSGPMGRLTCSAQAQHRRWPSRQGNRERTENLIHAWDRCDRRFWVVLLTPKNGIPPPRSTGSTASRYPHPTLVMELLEVEETTGEFRAKTVAR
jgi:hypothetical protein